MEATCPNCGAKMHKHSFLLVCDYCGYVTVGDFDKISYMYFAANSQYDIKSIYDRLIANKQRINESRFVGLDIEDSCIMAWSKKAFYANDFHYHKVESFSLLYVYISDGNMEQLFVKIACKEPEKYDHPVFAILINGKSYIDLRFSHKSDGYLSFLMSTMDLWAICRSNTIKIASNFIDEQGFNCNELKYYSCRFYNMVFDKREFLYSLNMNLITD